MHFLNGGRKYIHPGRRCITFGQQISDCLGQMAAFPEKEKIYKLNFFADVDSCSGYRKLNAMLEKEVAAQLPAPVLCSLIAQPPLTSRIVAEVFYFDENLWQQELLSLGEEGAMVFSRGDARVLFGQVRADAAAACSANATAAFQSLDTLLTRAGFPLHSVVRQWNYLENILGFDGEKQRYQAFNNARADYYRDHFRETGYPAATGIGMQCGGILIEFAAVLAPQAASLPVDNPEQVAAHAYSKYVLAGEHHQPKRTPKFERARYLELFGQKQLFISGTAAIRGEKTRGQGNAEVQTRLTIENIQKLYSPEVLQATAKNPVQPKYGHARVYVKNRSDFPVIQHTFQKYYGNLPVVYLLADICRDDLLVEIEGKVILERK